MMSTAVFGAHQPVQVSYTCPYRIHDPELVTPNSVVLYSRVAPDHLYQRTTFGHGTCTVIVFRKIYRNET